MNCDQVKGVRMTWSLLDSSIEMEILVSNEIPYFLITPVKSNYLQQMLFVKVL